MKMKEKEVFEGVFSPHLWDGFYDGYEYKILGVIWCKTKFTNSFSKKSVFLSFRESMEESEKKLADLWR